MLRTHPLSLVPPKPINFDGRLDVIGHMTLSPLSPRLCVHSVASITRIGYGLQISKYSLRYSQFKSEIREDCFPDKSTHSFHDDYHDYDDDDCDVNYDA